jgi:hypothetical protein
MRGSIRIPGITWDPEAESRASVANRIKRHVQDELNRIEDEVKHRRWLARRRASPTYERDRTIWEDHEFHGVDVPELAHRHHISRQYVREVLRVERHRQQREHEHSRSTPAGKTSPPVRNLPEIPSGIQQTTEVLTDP